MKAPNRSFWSNRRVCVTGGTGFLGLHLVRALRDLGASVRVYALKPSSGHPLETMPDVEIISGDILNAASTRHAMATAEVVFHTAGIVAGWGPALRKMHQVHVEGTRTLLQACVPETRIVHTSSIAAVGASLSGEILNEESSFNLNDLKVDYIHAKRNAELVALDAAKLGQDVVVVNPSYLVGPFDHEPSIMGRFCKRFWKGNLLAAPPGGLNFVDVRDVAIGHLLAAEQGRAGCRYILGGENHLLRDFMTLLAKPAGLRPRALPGVPWPLLRGIAELSEWRAAWKNREPYPGRQQSLVNRYCWFYRSDLAQRELGYNPRPLHETIQDTYAWFAGQKPFSWKGLNRWWLRPTVQDAARLDSTPSLVGTEPK